MLARPGFNKPSNFNVINQSSDESSGESVDPPTLGSEDYVPDTEGSEMGHKIAHGSPPTGRISFKRKKNLPNN